MAVIRCTKHLETYFYSQEAESFLAYKAWHCGNTASADNSEAIGLNFPTSSASQLLIRPFWGGGFIVNIVSSSKVVLCFRVDVCGHCTPHSTEMGQEFFSSGCSSLGVCGAECFPPYSSVLKLPRSLEEKVLLSTVVMSLFPSATALPSPPLRYGGQPASSQAEVQLQLIFKLLFITLRKIL